MEGKGRFSILKKKRKKKQRKDGFVYLFLSSVRRQEYELGKKSTGYICRDDNNPPVIYAGMIILYPAS